MGIQCSLATLRRVAVALCCTAHIGALADVGAQNASAKRYFDGLAQSLKCAAPVDEMVRRDMQNQAALPPHLAMSPESRRQGLLASVQNSLSEIPPAQLAMMHARPQFLRQMADHIGVSVDQFQVLLSGGQIEVSKPPSFLTRRSVSITVANELGALCDTRCVENFRWAVAIALSVWRSSCTTCADDFMSVVNIDGQTWLEPRLASWLRGSDGFAPSSYPFRGESNFQRVITSPEQYGLPAHPPQSRNQPPLPVLLELADPDDKPLHRVCAANLSPREGETDLPLRAQRALCPARLGSSESTSLSMDASTMKVVLTKSATSCGTSREFLGCARPDEGFEMTFEGTRYMFHGIVGGRSETIGPGTDPPLLGIAVVLHEVGHWFGLPHLNYKLDELPDVMQDTYREQACVSGLTSMLIINMSDRAHAERFRVGGGYRRAQRK